MNVCETASDVYRACQKYSKYYISEYIQKDQEFRVFVLSGRVLAVVEKIPLNKNEVSWGCVEQGRFKYLPWMEWPLYATEKALQATELSGLDFGAVDVLSRSEGTSGAKNAYVLEINTAPELTPYYMETFVKGFDYILQNGKDKIPITGTSGSRSFKNYIHPVLTPYAA
jgi:glutathione synthase/RimK-type ligase-like ATP-grasp enzyme